MSAHHPKIREDELEWTESGHGRRGRGRGRGR